MIGLLTKLYLITPQEYLVFYTLSGVVCTRRSQNVTQSIHISLQNTTEIVVQVAAIGSGGRLVRKSAALQVETTVPFQGFFPAVGIESTVLDLRATAVSQTSISILWRPPTQCHGIQVCKDQNLSCQTWWFVILLLFFLPSEIQHFGLWERPRVYWFWGCLTRHTRI